MVCACCFVASLLSIPPIKAQSTFSIPVDPGLPGAPATSAADLSKSEETVMMELWGIQISSSDPARLSTVMDQVNREIDETRRAMQYAYEALLVASRGIQINWINSGNIDDINARNLAKIVEDTGERGMPRISLADALFRINMANDASSIYDPKQCDSPNDFVIKKITCAEIPPRLQARLELTTKQQKIYAITLLTMGSASTPNLIDLKAVSRMNISSDDSYTVMLFPNIVVHFNDFKKLPCIKNSL